MWKAFITAGALSVASALPAAAATANLLVEDGILIGATGVTVATAAGTKTYNVEFLDGSCSTLFTNCGASDAAARPFAFTTRTDANAASQSLLDQVFVDVSAGAFDSQPGLTTGCSVALPFCSVITPFNVSGVNVSQGVLINAAGSVVDVNDSFLSFLDSAFNTGQRPDFVFARWTEVAVIPLPAGAPLVLSGLAAFVGLRWRKRRERRRAQV